MNIEPEYAEASLENFQAETTEHKHALTRAHDLVEGRIQKLVMIGANGTGKTHLACACVQALGGRIMSMQEIATSIRETYQRDASLSELQLVDSYARLPLFAIDELGRTKGGEAETNWLSYIIDKRHTRKLPTIIISNKHDRKTCPKQGCADCLENYIGDDIMSRLTEGGALVRFSGKDWRRTA